MNLTLSKRGDYVVRSALSLARAYPQRSARKIREVVAEMEVPQTFASQILADLVRAGLAQSKAGRDGGYWLARDPATISLLDVVEAGEGPLRAERCALDEGPCRWDAVCPLHETWGQATAAFRQTLAATTLAELATRDAALERGTYAVPVDSHRHAPTSVPVADWVQVELPAGVAATRIAGGEVWLEKLVVRAHAQVAGLHERLDPTGPPWHTSVSVAVSTGPLETLDDVAGLSLCWEATTPHGPASRLEARLDVRAVDPERADLRLSGRFRHPTVPSNGPDHPDGADGPLDRLGQVTVRAFLRELARALDEPPHPGLRTSPARRAGRPRTPRVGSPRRTS